MVVGDAVGRVVGVGDTVGSTTCEEVTTRREAVGGRVVVGGTVADEAGVVGIVVKGEVAVVAWLGGGPAPVEPCAMMLVEPKSELGVAVAPMLVAATTVDILVAVPATGTEHPATPAPSTATAASTANRRVAVPPLFTMLHATA